MNVTLLKTKTFLVVIPLWFPPVGNEIIPGVSFSLLHSSSDICLGYLENDIKGFIQTWSISAQATRRGQLQGQTTPTPTPTPTLPQTLDPNTSTCWDSPLEPWTWARFSALQAYVCVCGVSWPPMVQNYSEMIFTSFVTGLDVLVFIYEKLMATMLEIKQIFSSLVASECTWKFVRNVSRGIFKI